MIAVFRCINGILYFTIMDVVKQYIVCSEITTEQQTPHAYHYIPGYINRQ